MAALETYISQFRSLHVNVSKGRRAPHKAILLLSIIQLFEDGKVLTPQIFYDEVLEKSFKETWAKYAKDIEGFTPYVGTPFWHMNFEPFWKLVPKNAYIDNKEIFSSHTPGSYNKAIKECVRYAEIDESLFTFLSDKEARDELKKVLIDTYLK